MQRSISNLAAWASEPRLLKGASVFRVVGGIAMLLQYLLNYGQRRYLFGPEGVYPFDVYLERLSGFPVYELSAAPAYFEVVFHLGLLIALAWTLGLKTRWLTPLNLIFWRGLHERNPMLWDGGDNLMSLLLVYACFANVSAYVSIDAALGKPASTEPAPEALKARSQTSSGCSGILHNGAMLAMALQLCLVYGIAGLTKVQGEVWRNGTALYFAFADPEHAWPGVTDWLSRNGVLLTLLAYATVAFQIAFSFLLFANRRARALAVCVALLFHVGIALCMGLVTFGLFMMAADLTLIEDRQYDALASWARRRLWPASTRHVVERGSAPEQGGGGRSILTDDAYGSPGGRSAWPLRESRHCARRGFA